MLNFIKTLDFLLYSWYNNNRNGEGITPKNQKGFGTMKITTDLVNVWNSLVDWGFHPELTWDMCIRIRIRDSSGDLNLCAATQDFGLHRRCADSAESEIFYFTDSKISIIVYDTRGV